MVKLFKVFIDCHSKTIILCHACSLLSFFWPLFRIKMTMTTKKTLSKRRRRTTPSLDESLSPTGTVMSNPRKKKWMKTCLHREAQTIMSSSLQLVRHDYPLKSVSYFPPCLWYSILQAGDQNQNEYRTTMALISCPAVCYWDMTGQREGQRSISVTQLGLSNRGLISWATVFAMFTNSTVNYHYNHQV